MANNINCPKVELLYDDSWESRKAIQQLEEAYIPFKRIYCCGENLPAIRLGGVPGGYYHTPVLWWTIEALVELYGKKSVDQDTVYENGVLDLIEEE